MDRRIEEEKGAGVVRKGIVDGARSRLVGKVSRNRYTVRDKVKKAHGNSRKGWEKSQEVEE